jgi:hypothetical protein
VVTRGAMRRMTRVGTGSGVSVRYPAPVRPMRSDGSPAAGGAIAGGVRCGMLAA